MEKRLSVLLVLCFFLSTTAFAVTKKVGPYTVDVDILNSAQYTIPAGKISCDLWGKTIYVRAHGIGYQSIEFEFNAGSGQTYFKRVVQLGDIEKQFTAIDFNQKPLHSVYFDKAQFGADPNFYQLTAFIPQEAWPQATEKRVDIYDDFLGVFLKKSCVITKVEDFYQVRMTMTRKAAEYTARRLYVVFNTKPASPAPTRNWVASLGRAEKLGDRIPSQILENSAQFLLDNVSSEELREAGAGNSMILNQRVQALEKFEAVHQIPHLAPETLLQFRN